MEPTQFVIIGGGWRSEFFLRIARELPDRFRVSGLLVRDSAKASRLEKIFGVPTHKNLDELLSATEPAFAVVSVSRSSAPLIMEDLSQRKLPILCETPPGADLDALAKVNELTARGARIQVAEQYLFQPMHAARLAVARSGLLGDVSQAQVSYTHGYHGISLLRHYLGVKFAPVKITAMRTESPIFKGPDRAGPPVEEKIISCPQTLAWFQFENQLGVYDFAQDQHRSFVRSDRVLIRGERGEINQTTVRHLVDYRTPMRFELERLDAGIDTNMEGYSHKAIVGANRYWYENPFIPARLSDDEIAVATCLSKMVDYSRGGDGFYSLAQASHDHYLSLKMDEAVQQKKTIEVIPEAWAR